MRKLTAIPTHEAFLKAYLGEANMNASHAAIAIGVSPTYAAQRGYELLHDPRIAARIADAIARKTITSNRALANLAEVACAEVVKPSPRDIIYANEVILKAHGALADKRPDARVTVHIGFLPQRPDRALPAPDPLPLIDITTDDSITSESE
jgi:hypothetical protein